MSRYYRNYHRSRQQQKSAEVFAKSYIFLTPFILLAFAFPILWIAVFAIFYQINNSVEKKYKPKKKTHAAKSYSNKKRKHSSKSFEPKRSVGENILYKIIKEKYPNQNILRNERPNWLKNNNGNNLELDIFLPDLNLAFEFHGRQHRDHVPYFGSYDDFQRQLRNDELKRKKCKLKGVTLIEIWFDDPLTNLFVEQKLQELFIHKNNDEQFQSKNVIPIHQNRSINNEKPLLPCTTCGYRVCKPEYHFGA
jgi:hypothetical protein